MVRHRQETMTTSRYTAKMTLILGKYGTLAFVCTGKLKYIKNSIHYQEESTNRGVNWRSEGVFVVVFV